MDFGKPLHAGTIIYRSIRNMARIEGGKWYTLQPQDSFNYGPFTFGYRLKEDLKFIDFTNMNFYNDVMSKINKMPDDPFLFNYPLKYFFTFMLGFTDTESYIDFARKINIIPANINNDIKINGQLFNNRFRYSDLVIDSKIFDYLKDIYGGTYNGIIMEKPLPTILQNGYQHPEIWLFDHTKIEPVQQFIRPAPGGGFSPQKSLMPLHVALSFLKAYRDYIIREKPYDTETNNYYINYGELSDIEFRYDVQIPRKTGTNIPEDLDSYIKSVTPKDFIPPKAPILPESTRTYNIGNLVILDKYDEKTGQIIKAEDVYKAEKEKINHTLSNSETRTINKTGGAKKKHRYTRRQSRKE